MAKDLSRGLKAAAQRALFSLEQFGRHEMANHAAAGAYAFLLSALPALLVVLYLGSFISRALAPGSPGALPFILPALDAFGAREILGPVLERPIGGLAGAFGLVNLIWAARLFVVSIQRGIRVIHAGSASMNPVRENALTFAVELIAITAAVLLLALAQIGRSLIGALGWQPARAALGLLAGLGLRALPLAVFWLFVFLTYLGVPPKRPSTKHALISSALCVVFYLGLSSLLGLFLSGERYGLLYGILGSLIAGLIKVYFFFWLYFFFAELCFTMERYDSLLFARFHAVDTADKAPGAIERRLFAQPQRLFKRYARDYADGEAVFGRGEGGDDAFYLYKGRVGVYLEDPANGAEPAAFIEEGQFFGEMASVLKEPRSAWTVAAGTCTVFRLPAALFQSVLRADSAAAMKLVGSMAARLAANNERDRAEP